MLSPPRRGLRAETMASWRTGATTGEGFPEQRGLTETQGGHRRYSYKKRIPCAEITAALAAATCQIPCLRTR